MTPKEYLSQATDLANAIRRKHEQLEQLQAIAKRSTSTYTATRVGGTSERSKLENAVAEIDELRDKLARDMAAYVRAYREISAVIKAVENRKYRELLELRYLNNLTWEEVAVRMKFSYVHVVHNLHPAALKMIKVNSI